MTDERYDVVVIGGGAAGLAGATALARSRRRVVVVDEGRPRNAPADGVHNYLGREGTSPLGLYAIGRDELAGYGGEVLTGRAETARAVDGGFVVNLAGGRELRARRLLLATGVTDALPDLPGLRELWGTDVLHCPYCHGWEARDRAIGVIATSPMVFHAVHLWRQLSADVVLFLHDQPEPGEQALAELAARGIRVVRGAVAAADSADGRLTGVRLASGELVERQTLVVQTTLAPGTTLLDSLGLKPSELEMGGQVAAEYVQSERGMTAVPGVWVAGNLAEPMGQVIGAAAAGLMAGAQLNAELVQEDVRHALHQDPLVDA